MNVSSKAVDVETRISEHSQEVLVLFKVNEEQHILVASLKYNFLWIIKGLSVSTYGFTLMRD